VLQGNIIQGFLFSLGAILGDLVFAFIKRRLGYPPGAPWPIGDQVGFIIFAILLGSLVEPRPDLSQDLTLLLTTIPVHYISNLFAWGLKWKKNPW
jgi:CDP-2,3-bis-(O-geranylgeranyl)-sn-glycerol synthase